MVWTKRIFGPGPERLTNVFLSRLAEQVSSSGDVLDLWRPGVLDGLEPDFSAAGSITISAGACLTAGRYIEFTEDDSSRRRLIIHDAVPGEPVWLYVNADGNLAAAIGLPPGWPDHLDQPTTVEQSYCVVGWAVYQPAGWAEPRDVRHFIRSVPNDAILVVGDINAGADFENLQQALDYLEACSLAGREVSRHIVVTQDQHLEQPLQVRLPGVRVEARPTGSESAQDSEHITLSWDFGLSPFVYPYPSLEAYLEDTALFDLNGHADISIEGFNIVRGGELAAGVLWDPGDRLRLARCRIDADGGSPGGQLLYVVLGIANNRVLDQLRIEENQIHGLVAGLSYFVGIHDGFELIARSTSCFRHSVIRRNRITVEPSLFDWPEEVRGWRERDRWAPVVDCGQSNTHALFNRITENEITGGQISIRVGRQSHVHNNVIRDAALYGVLVENAGLPTMGPQNVIHGGTEISGNVITMWDPQPEPPLETRILESPIPEYELPWWRSAIHLELISCRVARNRIDLNNQIANGITSGLLEAFSLEDTASLSSPVDPPRVGLNELAHGWVVLTETEQNQGQGFKVTTSDQFRHQTPAGNLIDYSPDRNSYLPPEEYAIEPRSLLIFVQAETVGPDGYMSPDSELTVPPEAEELYTAKVADTGLTGIFDDFLYPPAGDHVIIGNDIDNFAPPNPIEWTAGESGVTLTQPGRAPDGSGLIIGSNLHDEFHQVTTGRLQERDIDSGEVLQQVELAAAISTKPVVHANKVYVCTQDRKVQCRELADLSPDTAFVVYTAPGDIEAPPVYIETTWDHDLLAFATTNGWVVFLKAHDGLEVSKTLVGGPIHTRPCSYVKIGAEYFVVVGSDDHSVYSINSTGELDWSVETGGKVRSSATYFAPYGEPSPSDTVYFGSDDGRVYCYNVEGEEVWTFQLGDKIRSPIATYLPEGIDPYVLAGTENGKISCLAPRRTGIELSWDYDAGMPARMDIVVKTSTGVAFVGAAKSIDGLKITDGVRESRISTLQASPSAITDLGESGLGINDVEGRFLRAREETTFIATAPPVTGFGIALPSAYNRVTGNQITGSSCGIFVLDRNKVGENIVFSAAIGILANARNTVWANQVWFYQAYGPEGLLPQNPLLPVLPLFCGIAASRENAVEANLLWGLPFEVEIEDGGSGEDGAIFGAITLAGVPWLMLGGDMPMQFLTGASGGRPLWVFTSFGGNTVSGNKIDLGIEVEPGQSIVGVGLHCGIVSLSNLLGSIPSSFKEAGLYPPVSGGEELLIAIGFNTLIANSVVRCGCGIVLFSADIVEGCRVAQIVEHGIIVTSRLGPRIQGCHVADVGGHALHVSENKLALLTVRDSVLMRPADPQSFVLGKQTKSTVLIEGTVDGRPEVHLSDCLIVNHEHYGIEWGGSHGSCNNCYFFTMNPDNPVWSPDQLVIDNNRKAAIVFDHEGDTTMTQGNLVVGAHMAHCLPRRKDTSDLWKDTKGPIQFAGENFFPPVPTDDGWSNRIHWRSDLYGAGDQHQNRPGSCYYVWTTETVP